MGKTQKLEILQNLKKIVIKLKKNLDSNKTQKLELGPNSTQHLKNFKNLNCDKISDYCILLTTARHLDNRCYLFEAASFNLTMFF